MTFDEFCQHWEMTEEEADAAWLHIVIYRAIKMFRSRKETSDE